jgi:hypothetical protein
MQFEISGAQARTLQEALTDAQDGSPVLFTKQDDGTLVVAFSLATYAIEDDGSIEEI